MRMSRKRKTIKDVTTTEWARLTEAAIDALSCARFLNWLRGPDADGDDPSVRDSLDRLAGALEDVGLPQGSIEEFEANIEEMLRSNKHPHEWARAKHANKSLAQVLPAGKTPQAE